VALIHPRVNVHVASGTQSYEFDKYAPGPAPVAWRNVVTMTCDGLHAVFESLEGALPAASRRVGQMRLRVFGAWAGGALGAWDWL
jgi:hypothetical protein